MFEVLKPIYKETSFLENKKIVLYYAVSWEVIGHASNMKEAKQLFGGSPVLRKT